MTLALNRRRRYAIYLRCRCGLRFESDGQGLLHECPVCRAVYNTRPDARNDPVLQDHPDLKAGAKAARGRLPQPVQLPAESAALR